jgi:HPt (histidine-containing phosphotransfer) domain-containing protein
LLHKFKGAAASMALTDVAARAAELEQALRAGQDPREGIASLQAAMDTVLETIRRFAPEEDPSAGPAVADKALGKTPER